MENAFVQGRKCKKRYSNILNRIHRHGANALYQSGSICDTTSRLSWCPFWLGRISMFRRQFSQTSVSSNTMNSFSSSTFPNFPELSRGNSARNLYFLESLYPYNPRSLQKACREIDVNVLPGFNCTTAPATSPRSASAILFPIRQ